MTYRDHYSGRWVCPRCGWTYDSPIPIRAVFHRCPERDDKRRYLRPTEDAERDTTEEANTK